MARSHPQHPDAPRTNEWTFFEYDDLLGWRNRPGAQGWFEIPDSSTYVRISSEGLRDVIHGPKTDRPRILVLGDSFVWGFGVEEEDRATNRLQHLIGTTVEVINAGVSGWGTDQELLYLERDGLRFEPDLVVVVLGLEDLENIHSSMEYTYPKPYFVLREGNLERRNVPVPQRTASWVTRFGVQPQRRPAPTAAAEQPDVLHRTHHFLRNHLHTYNFIWSRVGRIFRRRGWTQSVTADPLLTRILVTLRETCAGIGARPLLVVIPYRYHMAGTGDDAVKEGVLQSAENAGIESLDLWPEFRREAAEGRELYFKVDPHWNPAGHALAAQAIADHLHDWGWFGGSAEGADNPVQRPDQYR